jgi:membrane protease YdiL (CAAX protease family)
VSAAPIPPRPDLPQHAGGILVHGLDVRPPATWPWWEALVVYVGAFLVGGIATIPVLGAVGERGVGLVLGSLVASAVALGVVVLWLHVRHPTWTRVLGLPRPAGPDLRAGILFGIGLYPVVAFIVGALLVVLFRLVTGEVVRPPEQLPSDLGPGGIAVAVLYAVVVAPVSEELFFRGVLFRSLRDRHGFWPGALGSSVAFGSIHYVPAPALDVLLLMTVMVFTGLGLAFIYERRGSLWAPMAAHATFNVIGLALIHSLR